ncbi:hypothetical protein FA09DRAFT_329905 [Tilletiopsis washingtonensis]|uniref:Uncharacterized protein n=1 Tax=Tilletiopsis washingtonensis TaxID=58919 RepID=A0A316ZAH9_9BASI|nr:hypothetical protein FA09DRAFT_329905 [Tilletiopsis washingtonensis]PWN98306.1 hypothetical protein FA09DRAFT_329905 [Tilletiopsis washingtonensis]
MKRPCGAFPGGSVSTTAHAAAKGSDAEDLASLRNAFCRISTGTLDVQRCGVVPELCPFPSASNALVPGQRPWTGRRLAGGRERSFEAVACSRRTPERRRACAARGTCAQQQSVRTPPHGARGRSLVPGC